MNQQAQLRNVRQRLLRGKTWRYLRYLHARKALMLADDVRSILVIGAGHGLAELALAIEFPEIQFTLSDVGEAKHRRDHANILIEQWGVTNVHSALIDILDPPKCAFDMVYSIEVLEHIEADEQAAQNMRRLARKYVFCLVPFAEDALNASAERRKYALEKQEHFVCGYDTRRLMQLFPQPVAIRGAYWQHAGARLRKKMKPMSRDALEAAEKDLMAQAELDLIDRIPVKASEAQGIWWLSRGEA